MDANPGRAPGWSSLDPELWHLILQTLTEPEPDGITGFEVTKCIHSLLFSCKRIRDTIAPISEWLWERLARLWLGFLPSSLPSEFPSWHVMWKTQLQQLKWFDRYKMKELAICFAIERGHLKLVDQLVTSFQFENLKKPQNFLWLAAYQGFTEIVVLLLNRIDAIEPEFMNSKLSVLHVACKMGNTDLVRAILQCPPFVDRGDNTRFVHQKLNELIEGVPPLGHAYENGHLEIAKMLVDHGADCNWLRMLFQEGKRQFKPMLKHPECLDYFFGTLKGAQMNSITNGSLFFEAIWHGNISSFGELANHYPTEAAEHARVWSYLLIAVVCSTPEFVEFFLDSPTFRHPHIDEITLALCIAIGANKMEMVKPLMEMGKADPNKFIRLEDWNASGIHLEDHLPPVSTPLFWACSFGRVEMVRYLLEHGADTTLSDVNGKGCLHFACTPFISVTRITEPRTYRFGFVPVQHRQRHVQFGVKIAPNASKQDTPERKEIAELLISAGTSPNTRSKMGNTPLSSACGNGLVESARVLLSHGADSRNRSNDGGTPLHFACAGGCLPIVTQFLEEDPQRINETTNSGLTPFDFAWRAKKKNVMVFLLTNHWEGMNQEKMKKRKGFRELVSRLGVLPLAKQLFDAHWEEMKKIRPGPKQQRIEELEAEAALLRLMVKKGKTEVIEFLLSQLDPRREPIEVVRMFEDLLWLACEQARVNTFGCLLKAYLIGRGLNRRRGEFLDDPPTCAQKLLHLACERGHLEMVKMIFESGTKEVAVNDSIEDSSPLTCAIYSGNPDLVRFLLFDMMANPNKVRGNNTVLQHMLLAKLFPQARLEMVQAALKAGAFINVALPGTQAPLALAVHQDDCTPELVSLLLQNGAKVESSLRWKVEQQAVTYLDPCAAEVMRVLIPGLRSTKGLNNVDKIIVESLTNCLDLWRDGTLRERSLEEEIAGLQSQMQLGIELLKEHVVEDYGDPTAYKEWEVFFLGCWAYYWALRKPSPNAPLADSFFSYIKP